MRLTALYAFIFVSTLGAWTAINLLWGPEVVAWDSDSFMVIAGVCLFGAVGAGSGLGTLVPQQRLPKLLRGFPATAGAAIGGFAIYWATTLTPPAVPDDWARLGVAIGGGIAVALLSAVLRNAFPDHDRGALGDGKPRHRLFLVSFTVALALAAAFLIYRSLRA
jgi:hypothetical protein